MNEEILSRLFELGDEGYREFQAGLIPTVKKERFIGVRTPTLRALAAELSKREDVGDFLGSLPHRYFDEYQLHAFIVSLDKDFERCARRVGELLPYIDNWATCDQLSPKVFKKHKSELLPLIDGWLDSKETYITRFGVKMLMEHFLDDGFKPEYADRVARLESGEYYINMMRAWYFATALAKQREEILPYFEQKRLDEQTLCKAIQKCVDSRRIDPKLKERLKSLRPKRVKK